MPWTSSRKCFSVCGNKWMRDAAILNPAAWLGCAVRNLAADVAKSSNRPRREHAPRSMLRRDWRRFRDATGHLLNYRTATTLCAPARAAGGIVRNRPRDPHLAVRLRIDVARIADEFGIRAGADRACSARSDWTAGIQPRKGANPGGSHAWPCRGGEELCLVRLTESGFANRDSNRYAMRRGGN